MTQVTDRLATALADRYALERELGAGGMATVYLAADLKHDRKVAIKVLKPELAAVLGAERFVQEIKTTAALSHPHILPLFDSGEAGGFLYYVMPYIQGETIREKLNRETQCGVDEAVRIAREVADALDYAHRHGVIHRDIKPENILLHDGRALVMDFGIALAVSAAAGGRMTETGLSLGTPHYMSPEQATAEKELSARSDVYSLATVLYEMLAGDPPHTGSSAQQIIMRIITDVARPVTELRKSVPPHVAAALATALEKLPADRFASARAFADALGATSYTRGATRVMAAGAAPSRDWRPRVAVPALALAGGALAFAAWTAMRPSAPLRVVRYEVVWPGGGNGDFGAFAVSPDGSRIVTSRPEEGQSRLFTRPLDQVADVELPGTEGAINPSFSPDGRRIAFMSGAAIRVMDVAGGPTTLVTDSLVGVPGLDWGADGYIYYDRSGIGPLLRVSEKGGVPEVVSTLDTAAKELQHVWPHALPNGRGVLMVLSRGGPGQGGTETDGIAILDLKSRRHRELFRGVYARYARSGHVLYATRDGSLMAIPFDQDRLEVIGAAVKIADGLFVSAGGTGAVTLAIASDGSLWYASGGRAEERHDLVWASRDGTLSPLEPPFSGNISDVALSPDGRRVAVALRGMDGGHVWVSTLGSPSRRRLTFERSFNELVWHPDGRSILATLTGGGDIVSVLADGSGVPRSLFKVTQSVSGVRWSPRGDWLVFSAQGERSADVFGIRPGTDSSPRPLIATDVWERLPSVSPDGRWLLYQATIGVNTEVYLRPFLDTTGGGRRQISSSGGRDPRWSADGREIFYRTSADSLVSVPVLPGPGFEVGAPQGLFSMSGNRSWDFTPDGKRFLLVRDRQAAVPKRLFVVENFFEELRAKVPR